MESIYRDVAQKTAETILVKGGQASYAVCLAVHGMLQLFYGAFRPTILPQWPSQIPGLAICARLTGVALIAASLAIVMGKRGREVALILGGAFLVSVLSCQLPYALFISPQSINLFSWGAPFNTLALAGCSFVVAASFPEDDADTQFNASFMRLLKRLMPFGRIYFCITIIRFGIGHYLHTAHDAALVPDWIQWRMFWIYFTGAALIGSGIAIIAKFKVRPIAMLLGTMIFLWVILLHIPRAVADPYSGHGNEIESASRALAESGTAFLIACTVWTQRKNRIA